MKKIISILILSFGFIAAKAQPETKILITYDENGNRILRGYAPGRPAPPPQPGTTADVPIAEAEATATDKNGTTALAGEGLNVYPNPSHDNFNIMVSEGILKSNAELVLIDQLGRVHQRKKIRSRTTTISTKGMADGVYSIIVQHGDTKTTTKVVKVTN